MAESCGRAAGGEEGTNVRRASGWHDNRPMMRLVAVPQAERIVLPRRQPDDRMLKFQRAGSVIAVEELLLVGQAGSARRLPRWSRRYRGRLTTLATKTVFMGYRSDREAVADPKKRKRLRRLQLTERMLGVMISLQPDRETWESLRHAALLDMWE